MTANDEPCVCWTDFTCMADEHEDQATIDLRTKFTAAIRTGLTNRDAPDVIAESLLPIAQQHTFDVVEGIARKWQWGEWANTPRYADRVQDRMAAAQHATEFLRARAEALRPPAPAP